jgi:hypothetical protein
MAAVENARGKAAGYRLCTGHELKGSQRIATDLLAGAYHAFAHPQDMLRKIRESLKPEGRLVIIEYRKEDASLPIPADQRMSIREIRRRSSRKVISSKK